MMNKNSETTKKTENMIINIEAKLKQDFDSNIEDMHARVNDVIDQIGEIKMNINERDGMPSSTPLPATGDDKILDMVKEMILMNENFQEIIMKNIKDKAERKQGGLGQEAKGEDKETRESE